jgi:hypothetical protein
MVNKLAMLHCPNPAFNKSTRKEATDITVYEY